MSVVSEPRPRIGPDELAAIRQVGASLETDSDRIAATMVEAIAGEVPAYRRGSRDLLDDVLELSTATARVLGQALAAGRGVRREDVPIVREHASRRLSQGIELEPFLHAYRAALFRYWDHCVAAANELALSREQSLALARFALDAIDTITTHAAEAYLREDARVRTRTGRAARDLTEQLITGRPVPDDRRHPAAAGLDPRGRLVTIVGRVVRSGGQPADALQLARDAVEQTMALGKRHPLVTIRHGELIVIAAGTSVRETISRLQDARARQPDADLRYGVSLAAQGFAGVRRAYQEAISTLAYTSASRPVLALTELSSLQTALLAADQATQALIAAKSRGLHDLSDEERRTAADTIRAFAASDMNVRGAAERIGVHPNTVRYRLERIASSTGHDPRTFDGLTELVCAIELARASDAE
jgi:PucR C-terminal helix-turn-helix domain/GGDEF-like domain